MCVRCVSDVNAADVKMREAASDGEHAEDEADEKADEEEGFHGFICCVASRVFCEPVVLSWWWSPRA